MFISFCRTLFYKIACKGTTFFAHMQILEIKKSKLIFFVHARAVVSRWNKITQNYPKIIYIGLQLKTIINNY